MRLRRKADTIDVLQGKERIVLNAEQWKGRWMELFVRNAPVHAELGMGKGRFITELARLHPDINFIGIDRYDELIRRAYEKALVAGAGEMPGNLVLVRANVEHIDQMFAESELSHIYLNHSDPWPKKRHENRRLTHPRFMNKYMHILEPGGEIHLKTDAASLFEYSLNVFADMNLRMRNISLNVHAEGTPPGHVFTEYEQKFVAEGLPIYRVEVLTNKEAGS
ncbi:tRNA (guanosine(46)-N7)-methyltransferase TrmB [Xylanibacillus composti]|uniref:tRNA (guanine-N(7)-)-methyltransferase n=1 Tax=Xylanibacillus composti TaxID=1572762 RepID=A0A8J4H3E4_9BACL|nr:tRNA (guanosine(46)-N7)-methyltransferase TrmB [Xylanibacillus composti]MDT9724630.1 tRNA (guanosine(46)-N7)-methyltransferase TrmB [Xylanibacillus composti]GIQ70243.1 tRNA (guanine-N(7)-)-methyltransferase [Xylanibacillus composti]